MTMGSSSDPTVANGVGGVGFNPKAGERFVSFSITDMSGTPVLASYRFADSTGSYLGASKLFCASQGKVAIPPGTHDVGVIVLIGACGSASSLPVAGTVTANLYKR